jgi:hypothetical protein
LQLVAAGLLTCDGARRGQRAAYSLTEAGIQVLPVMIALGNWVSPTAAANAACASDLLRDAYDAALAGPRNDPLPR